MVDELLEGYGVQWFGQGRKFFCSLGRGLILNRAQQKLGHMVTCYTRHKLHAALCFQIQEVSYLLAMF